MCIGPGRLGRLLYFFLWLLLVDPTHNQLWNAPLCTRIQTTLNLVPCAFLCLCPFSIQLGVVNQVRLMMM